MNSADPSPLPGPLSPSEVTDLPAHGIDFTDPNSRLAPYYLQVSHIVAAGLVALTLIYASVVTPLSHGEIWGRLKLGEWIAVNAALPAVEPFAVFADPDRPFVAATWLADVLFYGAYRAGSLLAGGDAARQMAGGVEMLRGLLGVCVALRFAFLVVAYRRVTDSLPWASAGLVIAMLLTALTGFNQGPLLFAELWFALLLWLLASGTPLSARSLAVIAVVFALWANTHPSFVAGLALLAVLLVGRLIEAGWSDDGWRFRRAVADRPARRLAIATHLAGLATLANPYGLNLYTHLFATAGDETTQTFTGWLPLDFSGPGGAPWIYLAILVALTLAQAASRRALTPTAMLLILGFGVAPLVQRRLFVWWVPLVPLLLVPLLQDIADRLGLRVERRSIPSFRKTLLAASLGLVGLAWSGPAQLLARRDPMPLDRALSTGTPLALAAHLNPAFDRAWPPFAHGLAGYPNKQYQGRIFTSVTQSDFLLWMLPESRSRDLVLTSDVAAFPREHWDDCVAVLTGAPMWWEVLERYRVNLVVIEAEERPKLAEQLRADSAWQVILDEAGGPKRVAANRLLIALRKHPL